MSKAAVAKAPPAEGAEGAGKSKKKLMIIIIAAAVVLGGGGGAAFFMMSKKKPVEGQEVHEAEHKGPPVFAQMEPFVVNMADPGGDRYLQLGISFEVEDAKMGEAIKAYTPILRSRILIVLSSKDVAALSTVEGKQQLMDELLDMARETIKGPGKTKGVVDVHFTSFVIQ